MPLEQLKLDNLTWAEMVLAIRRRIAAASDGRWTLHAAVDPGVTLLELFAYLLEQRVFWMDQIPDSLVHAALALMGEEARPAQPAATVLRFSPQPFLSLRRLTRMRLRGSVPPIVFSTDAGVTLLPIHQFKEGKYKVGLYVNGQDRTPDLEQGRVVQLFPSDQSAAEVKIVLWLSEEFSALQTHRPLAMLFEMAAPGQVVSQWSSAAVKYVPPPAKLSWWYRRHGVADPVQFEAQEVEDGTGGLRRSGVVRLRIHPDWEPENLASPLPELTPYALWLRVERATFTTPPRLARLIPNVAIAKHMRLTKEHALHYDWLSLPGNLIPLSEIPAELSEKDHPPLEDTVQLSLKERDGEWHEWQRTAALTAHGPADRVFVVDRAMGALRFGDGLTGRLPVLFKQSTPGGQAPEPNIKVQYFVGGGVAGNLGSNLDWDDVAGRQLEAKNVVPADGGAETEPLADARQRAAAALKQPRRAVIPKDYEELVKTTPGVALKRAHLAVGYHPMHPCARVPGAVTVFVVPDAPGPDEVTDDARIEGTDVVELIPDPGAFAAVRERLDRARLVATEVFVRAPRYRHVSLAIEVSGDPLDPLEMRERIRERLGLFLDPLRGGDENDGWPFGEPLRPSALLREAQQAVGDDGSVIAILIGLDDEPPQASCADVEIGQHDLVALKDLTVRLRRSVASQGGLR